ncbi:hypothetical protein [Curtobacterium sp. Csp1]|uniref:hypothetical protein n=1 Tax=Curtobacterium sp. Csp1 TaxID=2495429 RepID=UPI0020C670FB|nr:hypothetical protein [Curtobacterium sp. Csp1]
MPITSITRRWASRERVRSHERVTAIATAQKTSPKTIRHATISNAPAGAIAAKSNGMSPHSPYATIAWTTPTDASERAGRVGVGSLTEPS